VHRPPDQVEVVERRESEIEVVELPGRLQPLRDLLGVFKRQPSGDHLVGAEAHAHGEVATHRLTDRRDHLQREPHAVVEPASVLIGAEVRKRRHELPGQGAVAELELHPVESAFADMDRRQREMSDDLPDVLELHDFGSLPVHDVGNGRRGPHRQPRQNPAALLPVVVDLGEDACVIGMDRPRKPLVPRDDLRPEGFHEVLVGTVGRVHRLLLCDDQARAAPGAGG